MLVDTHAHLFWKDFDKDLDIVIERAKKAGLERIVVPGVDVETSRRSIKIAGKYEMVVASIGIHPDYLIENPEHKIEVALGEIASLVKMEESVRAVGEIGIDLNTSNLRAVIAEQKVLFQSQCKLAVQYSKPVIIHTRESISESIEMLDELASIPRGVFHCFSGNSDNLKEILNRGFDVSFCGNITWSKRVRGLVAQVPQDRLLLETDSPFMTPRNEKGDPVSNLRNEPSHVTILAEIQAELRGEHVSELISYTGVNARALFNL